MIARSRGVSVVDPEDPPHHRPQDQGTGEGMATTASPQSKKRAWRAPGWPSAKTLPPWRSLWSSVGDPGAPASRWHQPSKGARRSATRVERARPSQARPPRPRRAGPRRGPRRTARPSARDACRSDRGRAARRRAGPGRAASARTGAATSARLSSSVLAVELLAEDGSAVRQEEPAGLDIEGDRMEHPIGHDLDEELVEARFEGGGGSGGLHEDGARGRRCPQHRAPGPQPLDLEVAGAAAVAARELAVDPAGDVLPPLGARPRFHQAVASTSAVVAHRIPGEIAHGRGTLRRWHPASHRCPATGATPARRSCSRRCAGPTAPSSTSSPRSPATRSSSSDGRPSGARCSTAARCRHASASS